MRQPPELPKSRRFHALQPWQCAHKPNCSSITAYVEASGTWETIGTIRPTSGASAETLATFITRLVNDAQQHKDLLVAAMDALQAVLDEGLTFTTERAADSVLARLKARGV